MKRNHALSKSFSLVEVMIAMTLFLLFSTSVFYLSVDTVQRTARIDLRQEALRYAQESLEAVRNLRDRDFLLLTNGDHGLLFQNGQWEFIPAPENINDFYERTVTIEDVYRNALGEIDPNGTFDPESKKITTEVSWTLRSVLPQSVRLETYLTNWVGDDWVQTTCSEFTQGLFSNTETKATAAPPEDNCALELSIQEVQSEFFISSDLGKHGNDVDVEGNYAYVATAETNLGLTIVNVTDPAVPTITKKWDVYGKGRKIDYQSNQVYMGVEKSNLGVAIVDVTSPSNPSNLYAWTVGAYGNEPWVTSVADYFYMGVETTGNAFLVYKRNPTPTLTDFLDFDDEVRVVKVNGQYAYLGCENDHTGLRIINISNPYDILQIATLDVGEEVNAIAISGAFAFVGTDNEDKSLQIVDISNPQAPLLITGIDVQGEIEDLVIVENYLYAAIDEENAGLAAINISNPLAPYLIYNRDILGKGTGIDAQGNYLYVTTDTSNKGLVIMGTTETEVNTVGSYESEVFDTGSTDTRYNFIDWEHTEVAGGSVKFQIRTAESATAMSTATWVGSDGTASTYYENPRTQIVLDPSRTGQQFFQFKAFLESDGNTSPTIESVRINYTP